MRIRLLLLLSLALPLPVLAASAWTQGVQYERLEPAQLTDAPPGKIEVTEVFSYGCPYCNQFVPTMHALVASLPANVQVDYLPASFSPAEDFPMFERAFLTAQALGIAGRTHDAMFDAVWKTGELSVIDPSTNRLRNPLPSIEDAARFYQRHAGVPAAKFLAAAHSFSVESRIARCDELVRAYRVDGTPSIIVNGKYRVNMQALHSGDELIELVNYLVGLESKQPPA